MWARKMNRLPSFQTAEETTSSKNKKILIQIQVFESPGIRAMLTLSKVFIYQER